LFIIALLPSFDGSTNGLLRANVAAAISHAMGINRRAI